MEKEREENIWRRITFYFRRIKNGEGKGGKYLEREKVTTATMKTMIFRLFVSELWPFS